MNDRIFRGLLSCLLLFLLPPVPGALARSDGPPGAVEPLTLRRAVELALARSPELAAARAGADEAGASAGLAAAGFRPEAFASTTPGYSTGLPVAVAGQVPAIFGVSVRTSLYDPARREGALAARAVLAGRQADLSRAAAATIRAVVAAYGRNTAGAALSEAARGDLEAREAIFRRAAALRAEGRLTDLDVENAGLEVARAKQKLLDRTLSRDFDALELRRLLDWPAGAPLALTDDPLAALPGLPPSGNLEAARASDPEIVALTREIESLARAAEIAGRSFRPVIAAEAQYLRLASYNHFDQYFVRFKPDDFAAAVTISVPLWTSGRTAQAAAAARARLARAEALLKARERDVELTVTLAEADGTRADGQIAVARSAEAAAREAVRIARELAAEGRGGTNDVERAQIALGAAQEQAGNAGQALLAARLRLLELRGEGWR